MDNLCIYFWKEAFNYLSVTSDFKFGSDGWLVHVLFTYLKDMENTTTISRSKLQDQNTLIYFASFRDYHFNKI
jgi:hypothetical protein